MAAQLAARGGAASCAHRNARSGATQPQAVQNSVGA